jgi:hypothetical protein
LKYVRGRKNKNGNKIRKVVRINAKNEVIAIKRTTKRAINPTP